jgi:benzoyl-CoA-dihydrodiol lyase
LVDDVVKTQQFGEHVKKRAAELARHIDRPADAKGVALTPLKRTVDDEGLHYETVDAIVHRGSRTVTITVRAPEKNSPQTLSEILELGAGWWPLKMARELDDAILWLRTNELELGLWILKTTGNVDSVLAIDEFILRNAENWRRIAFTCWIRRKAKSVRWWRCRK